MIVESQPDILRRAVDEGHDCGLHCWDHVKWQDTLPRMSREEIRGEFARAMELFARVSGTAPKSSAAPGWQASVDSLTVQDELDFLYCSDTRGSKPFMPRMGGVGFRTLQIPSTLPTLDELWGVGDMGFENATDRYLDLLEPGLNVHTVHTEMEGGNMSAIFERFLDCCVEGEVIFRTLKDVALQYRSTSQIPIDDVEMGSIAGRAGQVALQSSSGHSSL